MAERAHPDDPGFAYGWSFRLRGGVIPWVTRRGNPYGAAFRWRYKWISFTLSAAIAGLAGGLFAMAQEGAYVQVMALNASGVVVLMTLIGGGLVSFWGPVFGTVVYFVARDVLGALTETWLLWYGLLFMAIIMFKPDGIAGIVRDLTARWRPRS